ncbi:hypothetical protein OXYTRIMIC_444 [Oxytricha trifallax]|uniref:Uncharacterized protein n=1 Tax=Oxytricha trifallax TaxID=1172189 RepID=A0A073IBQ1_9SPIT|nr:hypothetical protein OXYTRIMIC_444 [Oxytricha trifallax]
MEEFKPLIGSQDLSRYLSKFILNKTTKNQTKSVKDKSLGKISLTKHLINNQTDFIEVGMPHFPGEDLKPVQNDTLNSQVNYGAKIQSEITSIYIREYMILKPQGRQDFIHKIFNRNSQSLMEFLQNLKTACSENLYENMFRLIYELNMSSTVNLSIKTRLFVSSLLYYNHEIIEIGQDLLKSSMLLLAQRPNTEQALGLSNYIFINEPQCLEKLQEEVFQLDKSNIGIIPLMIGTFQLFKIDSQAVRLLPNTLLCLNKAFIQIPKEDQGLRLICHVPINEVGDFIQICALSSSPSFQKLDKFINTMSEIFIQKWDYIDQEDFTFFLQSISLELKQRNPLWVNKIDELSELSKNLVFIQQEKGIRCRRDIIIDCLKADFTKLNQLMHTPNKTSDFNEQELKQILNKFRKLNSDSEQVLDFSQIILVANGIFISVTLKALLEFSNVVELKVYFHQFWVGNGKTLLCSTYAILLAQQYKEPVFVIGKNEHLVLRDEKNFEKLIISSPQQSLNVNVNQYSSLPGVYYLTQKVLENVSANQDFKDIWKNSFVIIDEYDWILLEGCVNQIGDLLDLISTAKGIVGFTGSVISQKELSCLKVAFDAQETVFPKLSCLMGDKRIKLQQELVSSNQVDYCKRIYETCLKYCKLTPVLIVAQQSYTIIENYFKKFAYIPFHSMKNVKGPKLEVQFEQQFSQKNIEGQFGVFLMNEQQGRGTDFKTSHEIDFNGGLFLIVGDVFSSRSLDQIIGRVGRLNKKGHISKQYTSKVARKQNKSSNFNSKSWKTKHIQNWERFKHILVLKRRANKHCCKILKAHQWRVRQILISQQMLTK